MEDFESQTDMGRKLDVPQAMLSGYLSGKPDTAIPQDETKAIFALYLLEDAPKIKLCPKWDIAEFTRYMDSKTPPDVFTAMLRDKPVAARMTVKEIASTLTDREKLELVELIACEYKTRLTLVA